MMTLRQFADRPPVLPTSTSWYLSDLGEARGRQGLFTRQAPQRLRVLREHALVESAVSSNRIEGVSVDPSRVGTIVFGKRLLRDRNEEEVRGYQEALRRIHEDHQRLSVSQKTVLDLHGLCRGEIWDAGRYRRREGDIIETYPNGRRRLRFKAVHPDRVRSFMGQWVRLWRDCLRERWVPPLVAMGGCNLDFLCIHPFRDGNGRVSRLLLLLQCHHLGYEVGRYTSLDRLIEENKQGYYDALERSSRGWHEGGHDPWPYVNFLLHVLKTACAEFEARLGAVREPRGAKTALVASAIARFHGHFTLAALEAECHGVSHDMVRRVLHDLRRAGKVVCLGRGPGAPWRKKG